MAARCAGWCARPNAGCTLWRWQEDTATRCQKTPIRALEAFLACQHKADPLRFPDLLLVIIKLMGSREYAVERPGGEPVGHFGLAGRDHKHSTAPIRRYPDLITMRMVKLVRTNVEHGLTDFEQAP